MSSLTSVSSASFQIPSASPQLNSIVVESCMSRTPIFHDFLHVLPFFDSREICQKSTINRKFRALCSSEVLWKTIAERECPKEYAQQKGNESAFSIRELCKKMAKLEHSLFKHYYKETVLPFHEKEHLAERSFPLDANAGVVAVNYSVRSNPESGPSLPMEDVVKFWDLTTGHELHRFNSIRSSNRSRVTCLKIDNGKLICTYEDSFFRVWNMRSAALLFESQQRSPISALFVKNGFALCGTQAGAIYTISIKTFRTISVLRREGNPIFCLEKQKNKIASGSSNQIEIWNLKKNKLSPLVLKGHRETLTSLEWAVDLLYSGSQDGAIKGWNGLTGRQVFEISPQAHHVILGINVIGNSLIIHSSEPYIKVWDRTHGRLITQYQLGEDAPIQKGAVKVLGSSIIVAGRDGNVRLLDFKYQQPLSQRIKHAISRSPACRETLRRTLIICLFSAILIGLTGYALANLKPSS